MRFLAAILLLLFALLPAQAQQGQGMSKAMVVSSCGGGAAPSGALNQLTMDTTGRLCQSGIGSNICAPAAAYLGRTVGGTEGGNAANITALICGLVTDGYWSNLGVLHVEAQQNASDSLLNLVGTSYTATKVGTPTFASYVGYSGFSISSYLDTGYNTSTGANYAQNSASMGAWSYSVTSGTGIEIGSDNSANSIFSDYAGVFYANINGHSPSGVTTPGTKGLFAADRSSSANIVQYWNGASQGTVTISSITPTNENVYVGASNSPGNSATNPTPNTICADFIASSLGPAGHLAVYNRLRTYMTAVGVP